MYNLQGFMNVKKSTYLVFSWMDQNFLWLIWEVTISYIANT